MKIIYVNCGMKNYLEEDHRSYIRNVSVFQFQFQLVLWASSFAQGLIQKSINKCSYCFAIISLKLLADQANLIVPD